MTESIRRIFNDLRQKASRVKDSERPYDFRAFIPLSDVLKYCNKSYRITEKKVRELCKLELLAVYRDGRGEESFPLFTSGRIEFIEDLKKKYQYPDDVFKEIIRHENSLILDMLSNADFFSQSYDSLVDVSREMKLYSENNPKNKDTRIIKKVLSNLEDKEWAQLSDRDKKEINHWILTTRFSQEIQIYFKVQEFRKPILLGYSPLIILKEDDKFEDTFVDWDKTLKRIKELGLRFVSVNSFHIAVVDNQVTIQIKNPQTVNTGDEYQRIRKIYAIFREALKANRWVWSNRAEDFKPYYQLMIDKFVFYREKYPKMKKYEIIQRISKDCTVAGRSFSSPRISRATTPRFIQQHGLKEPCPVLQK